MKKNTTKVLTLIVAVIIMAAFALSFTACDSNDDGDPITSLAALNMAIGNANAAKTGVVVSVNGSDVLAITKWVTQTVMSTLNSAISAAETAKSSATTQTEVNNAAATLNTAVTAFNNAKQNGTKTVSVEELEELIEDAIALQATAVVSVDGSDILIDAFWVTQAAMDALEGAIDNAQEAIDEDGNLIVAYDALSNAITAFTTAKRTGTYEGWSPSGGFTTLTENTWADGNIPSTGDREQWFMFTATASTQYIHFFPGTLSDVYVRLYDVNGDTTGSQANLYGSTLYISRTVTSGQRYYIRVWPYSSGSGAYKIGFNTSTTRPLHGWPPSGTTLTENTWADGSIPSTGTREQWFEFTATASTQYIHFSNGTLHYVNVQLYDASGATVGSQTSINSYTSRSVTNGQTYYIRAFSTSSGTYRIAFSSSATRPGWPPSDYTTLTEKTWANGNIPSTGTREQWFEFTATASTQYIHFSTGALNDVYVQLYDDSGVATGSQTNLYGTTLYTSRTLTSGQRYYIRVWPYYPSESGAYKIAFSDSSFTSGIE